MTVKETKALENVRAQMLCRPWYWLLFRRFIRRNYLTGFYRGFDEGEK